MVSEEDPIRENNEVEFAAAADEEVTARAIGEWTKYWSKFVPRLRCRICWFFFAMNWRRRRRIRYKEKGNARNFQVHWTWTQFCNSSLCLRGLILLDDANLWRVAFLFVTRPTWTKVCHFYILEGSS